MNTSYTNSAVPYLDIYLFKNEEIYPHLYPEQSTEQLLRQHTCTGKISLEILCKHWIKPSIIVGNDWFTGFLPAYIKYGHFGDYFQHSLCFHIVHNLGIHYEGRIYPESHERTEVSWKILENKTYLIFRTYTTSSMDYPGNR